jgi:hypothetical protein
VRDVPHEREARRNRAQRQFGASRLRLPGRHGNGWAVCHWAQPRASGKVSRSNRFSAVVHNLTDRMHLEWTNVRCIAANSPVLDSSTAPGRSVPVALVHDF